MKVLSLVGARPQFIKEAILHAEFKKKGIKEIIVHSGQHYDVNMSDIFFKTLGIKTPDYFLGVKSGLHGEMTGKIMIEFEKVLLKEKPNIVIVYGDTNTTLAGAIVSAKLKIPLAHVEAGIRMEPKTMPEEINRALTDRISDYLFCPSQLAVKSLKKEGIEKGVYFVGDVMYDLFLKMKALFKYDFFKKYGLKENEYVIVTIHRDYNVDDPEKLKTILKQLVEVSKNKKIVFPLHPRTAKRIKEYKFEKYLKKLIVTEPLDYLDLMGLTMKCFKAVTDSGGYQKEVYFARKQAIVVMPDTGWRELLGWNRITKPDKIAANILSSNIMPYPKNLYGKGDVGEKFIEILSKRTR